MKSVNIQTNLEQVEKRKSYTYSVADHYPDDVWKATGDSLTTSYNGTWEAMCRLAEQSVGVGGTAADITAEVSRLPGGLADLKITTKPVEMDNPEDSGDAGDSEDNPTYRLGVTAANQPLLSHPRYDKLTDEQLEAILLRYQGASSGKKISIFKEGKTIEKTIGELISGNDLALEALRKLLRGTEHYMAPALTLECRFRTTPGKAKGMAKNANLFKCGAPPGGFGTPRGYQWLNCGTSIEVSGREAWVGTTWQLSGPGGWDGDIYEGGSRKGEDSGKTQGSAKSGQ